MSRKLIILIAAILVLLFSVWAYFVFTSSPGQNGGAPKSILGSLFPFGLNSTTPTKPNNSSTTGGGNSTTTSTAPGTTFKRLIQISNKVVAGLTVLPPPPLVAVPKSTSSTSATKTTAPAVVTSPAPAQTPAVPMVRFAESGTGYIYDVDALGQNGQKTSGTVVSRTAQAFFGNGGTTVLLRYIKDDNETVATFLGHMVAPTATTSDGTLVGDFLPDNLGDISFSTDGKNLLFILPTANGIAGISMKSDGTAKKELFSSSFSEWLLDWGSGTPTLTTKASATVPGFAYSITNTGDFQKILGGIDGLTTKMSPDGTSVLYGVSGGSGLDLHIRHLGDLTDINTGLQTLPEKCIWSTDKITVYCAATGNIAAASYPDAWYQGTVHFNDGFWKINSETGVMSEVSDGEGNVLDATNLTLDSAEQYLFFINKTDGSLWSLFLGTPPATPAPATLPAVH